MERQWKKLSSRCHLDSFPAFPHTFVLCILQIPVVGGLGRPVFTLIKTAIQHGSQKPAGDCWFLVLAKVIPQLKPARVSISVHITHAYCLKL